MDTSLYRRRRIWALLAGSIFLLVLAVPRLALGVRLFTSGIPMRGEIIRVESLAYVARAGVADFVIPKSSVVELVAHRQAGEQISFVVIPNEPLSARKTAFPLGHLAVFAAGVAMLLVLAVGRVLVTRQVLRTEGTTPEREIGRAK